MKVRHFNISFIQRAHSVIVHQIFTKRCDCIHHCYLLNHENGNLRATFAVVPTDNIVGGAYDKKIPIDMNSIFMKLYVTCPT